MKMPNRTGCPLDPLFELGESPVVIPRDVIPVLPDCFEETLLGNPKSSIKQYRCVHGLHVREYADVYEIHADRFDPRKHPLLHLLSDTTTGRAAMVLIAIKLARSLRGGENA
ncbi:MAG: hypothetical protein QW767_05190 [Thermoprotei archaeon]